MVMYVAFDSNQQLIHINDVVRGLACECTCFCCHETVIAKKGLSNEHHFAHANLKDSCQFSHESVLHAFAKEVVLQSAGMMMPTLPDDVAQAATWWDFEKLLPEVKLGSIRPDLVGYCKGEAVLIEMAVTHFVDETKDAILQALQLKTVEVDLTELLKQDVLIPSEAAKQWILEQTHQKTWLFPKPKPMALETKSWAPSEHLHTNQIAGHHTVVQSESKIGLTNTWDDYQFTIHGMYVRARAFKEGKLALTCTYNPDLVELFKQWRREGGGRYNPKYKAWEYWPPFSNEVLKRLHAMHQTKSV